MGVTLKVSLEGTGTADDPVTFDVNLYDKGVFGPATADKPWLIFEKSAVRTFKGVTGDRADRTFTLLLTDVDPRFYDITIETNHTLVNLRDDVGVAKTPAP